MQMSTRTLLALAIAGTSGPALADSASQAFVPTQLKSSSAQAEATGFVAGQSLSGSTKNFFAQERTKRDTRFSIQKKDGTTESTSLRETWTQGTIVNYTSGFTQGTLGLAAQVAAYNEVALQQNHDRIAGGGNRTLTHADGDAVGQWSKLGLANLQARVSNTTITAGRQNMNTPMIATIGNRALPSSFEGLSVHSAEFNNLSFDAGTFDRVSPRTEQSLTRFVSEYGNRAVSTDHVSTAGVTYKPMESLETSFYATQAKDFWNQYYFGLTHDLGDPNSLALNTAFNYYKTRDEGSAKLGAIDNDTYSLALTLTHGAHSVMVGWQQVDGNEYFDYLHETNGIFLANSLLSDFNGPNEKSLQFGYLLNMAEYGVPGLKFNVYTARGWGIDGTHYTGTGYGNLSNLDGETHYEYGFGTAYTLQSGALKGSSVRATYTAHRASANQADGSLNELRVVTTVPFNIL
ncbi:MULTISPECIES: OprD family porin [unclassified Pseudomonas]|uniref:OprD family porin n=1 Tax=unclassified Pseudomonas TaxID=196821 RepID=UPI000BC4BEF6|nr:MULTISPECIES: OprD family porin [unclassified Pseudomonas]PVZ12361.1 outer membrane OprD family porin [Pseudomonas sp. URIL14HWK12:I12]PVZ23487.1 outer membrane OprD family porin [Pseudomonas sp. URIL14HWK12:I10]PVZ32817.1 outer membrane OprD family porin [Pseudomonas sp. URIL14HWK12:I11]SNZ14177.1 outer membrane porin, OprD family [Pseudomonas sp. URIL14HWK12:I9]